MVYSHVLSSMKVETENLSRNRDVVAAVKDGLLPKSAEMMWNSPSAQRCAWHGGDDSIGTEWNS